jgi:hypothetical protein
MYLSRRLVLPSGLYRIFILSIFSLYLCFTIYTFVYLRLEASNSLPLFTLNLATAPATAIATLRLRHCVHLHRDQALPLRIILRYCDYHCVYCVLYIFSYPLC